MRKIEYLKGIEGVISGGVASINLPVQRRYHAIKLFATATDAEASPITKVVDIIDHFRLIVNGIVMRDLTPAQARAIAEMNGQTIADNELPIYFSEPWRASITGEESTSYDMFGVVKATLEVAFKSGLTSPGLQALASYDFGRNLTVVGDQQTPFLAVIKQLRYNWNAPQGQYDITNIPVRDPIQRILMNVSTGTINAVDVDRDGEKVHEATRAQNTAFLRDYGIDASKFGYAVVFDFEQQISSPLIVSRDLLVRPTLSAAATITAVVESRANGYR